MKNLKQDIEEINQTISNNRGKIQFFIKIVCLSENSAEILEMSVQLAFEESRIKRRLIETDIRWKREEICEAGIELSIKRDLFNNKILRKHICKFSNYRRTGMVYLVLRLVNRYFNIKNILVMNVYGM